MPTVRKALTVATGSCEKGGIKWQVEKKERSVPDMEACVRFVGKTAERVGHSKRTLKRHMLP